MATPPISDNLSDNLSNNLSANISARILMAQDAPVMAQIHAQSFPRPWPALDMAVHVKTDLCLGIGATLSSFIIIRSSNDEAEILTIATEKSARRKGYGRVLLNAAFAKLQQNHIRTLFLEVAEDNAPAQALYKSCGFVPIGRRPAYYRREKGRVAAITFSKSVDAAS